MASSKAFYLLTLLVAVCLFLIWAWPLADRAFSGKNDFLQLYAGARLVGTPRLYDIEASKEIHREITGTYYVSVYFTRLPWYGLVLSPLGRLPYPAAYWIFQSISIAAFAVFLWAFLPRYRELALFCSVSVPLLTNFMNGQDAGLVTVLAAFSVLLAARGRDFGAGLVLALCSIKFHLFLLVPVAVLLHRRWGILKGGLAGGAALFLLSILADGPRWPLRFLNVVGNPELHPGPDHMPTLRGLTFALAGENRALELALIVPVAALFAWLAHRIRSYEIVFGLSLAGGLLVCHHAYMQDCMVLLLALVSFETARASRLLRGVTIVAVLPPAYFMLLHGVPYNAAVPLLLIAILVAAIRDAGVRTGSEATSTSAAAHGPR
ncbi:MAG: glycosyltransferase family 87 protein [Bryobacteraceae bacterium]